MKRDWLDDLNTDTIGIVGQELTLADLDRALTHDNYATVPPFVLHPKDLLDSAWAEAIRKGRVVPSYDGVPIHTTELESKDV